MQKRAFNIGIDVSKKTLDVFCFETKSYIKIQNDSSGFKVFLKFCKDHQIDLKNTIIVLEYTGGYEYRFLQFCQCKQLDYCRVPGMSIKRSIGVVRGKADKVDSQRIAQFAEEKYKTLEVSKPLNINTLKLKKLLSYRKRLVRENAGYKASACERKHMYQPAASDLILRSFERKIKVNLQEIELIEAEINALFEGDEAMKKNLELITSVRGIGKVNGWMTIAYTENFNAFTDARKYAVYVGVVPFEHQSGTSIKKRSRVSHIANKELKQELTQGAKSAIQWDPELKQYATRMLEKKHYMVVVNNVKFKLIMRMFSVVKRGQKYVDNYQKVA